MDKKQIRAAKIKRQQELLDAAKKAGNRSLTDTEQAEFDSLQREIDTLTEEIRAAENPQTPADPAPAQNPTPAPEDNIQRAIAAERTRVNEITAMCRDFGVSGLEDYIQNGSTVEQVRAAIMDGLRKNGAPLRTGIQITGSGEDDFRRDAADGLLIRSGMNPEKATNGAQQMANMTLRDMAIECLERSGAADARRKSSDDLFTMLMQRQFYNPTAAFPAILDNAINKSYVEGHRKAPVTFDRWTKKGSLKDFKVHDNNYLAGPIGDFLEVPEGGELKNDKPTDAKLPTRRLHTYGKQFTLSRQAFINDDIDLVTSIPARHAAAARRTINTQCYQILMGNPAIYDGKKLFSAEHRNLLHHQGGSSEHDPDPLHPEGRVRPAHHHPPRRIHRPCRHEF